MRFLIVEDDPGMGVVLRQKLDIIRTRFPAATITLVRSLAAAKHETESYPTPDTTILDLTLLDAFWEETVAAAPAIDAQSPVVIITGHPVEKVRALLANDEIEVLGKTPEVLSGNFLFEAIYRALNRKADRETKRMKADVAFMREFLDELYGPATPAPSS